MKPALIRFILACSILATLFASAPLQLAQAQTQGTQVPASLQQSVLAATAKPFTAHNKIYGAEVSGVNYQLNAEGLQVKGNGLSWGIALRGMGRGNTASDVPQPEIVQVDGRLEYQRGTITEWYRNTVFGVEQGFEINAAPKGNGQLVLHLDLSTEAQGKLNEDERGISFEAADGQTLRYDQLRAYDANGSELAARMQINSAQVSIQVDDHGAVYPITIDPLIYLQQKNLATDGAANDFFGRVVALSGDTAIVGAPGENALQGAAYIFVRSGSIWTQQAKLTAADGQAGDAFASSVALSGDTALVGAYFDSIGVNMHEGSAYVFVRNGTTWSQQAKLTASDKALQDRFGYSVAISGDKALVGAYMDDVGANQDQGSAYLFTRNRGSWTEAKHFTANDGAAFDYFGTAVALENNTAIISAPSNDLNAGFNQGAAYVFVSGWLGWTQQTKLTDILASDNDGIGTAVALSGNTALLGAPAAYSSQGMVDVFVRNGTIWTKQQQITAPDGAANDQFGSAVALINDTALIGSSNHTVGGNAFQGAAYVFTRSGTTWSQQKQLTASGDPSARRLGSSVALSDNTALAGAPLDAVSANVNQGSIYFYQAYQMGADLALSTITGSGTVFYPGDTLYLTATVTNYGPSTANGVMLNVTLPAGFKYVSSMATHGSYTYAINSWSVGDLPAYDSATLTITATVNMISVPAKVLTFSATSLALDTNNANNSASLNITVKKKEQALNGGFNTYPTAAAMLPANWNKNANFSATDGKDVTAANIKEGAAAIKISNTSAKNKILTQILSTLSGAAGDPFIFSYWVKGSAIPTTAGVCAGQVVFYNGANVAGTKTLACGFTGTFAYKKKTLSFTAPAAYTKVMLKFSYSKASGTVWFDWASLLK